jgi:hypothetical protein
MQVLGYDTNWGANLQYHDSQHEDRNVHGLATEKKENRLEKAKRALETQPWRANLCHQGTLK